MAEFRKGGFGGKRPGGFRNGGNGGGRPSFGHKGTFGHEEKQLFSATCADCGNSCEVPFRPSGERPVFCKNCFGDKREAPRNDFARREAPRAFEQRAAFVPAAKPHVEDKRIDELKRQLDGLHKKVDSLTHMMEVAAAAHKPTAQEEAKAEPKAEAKADKKQEKPAKAKAAKPTKKVAAKKGKK